MKNIKKASLVLTMLVIVSFAFGQFTIGPKVGYHASELTTNIKDVESDFKDNFNFGIFLRTGQKVYLQPEVNFLDRGGIFNFQDTGSNSLNQEIDIKTLEVPLLLGFQLIKVGIVNLRVMTGPSASFVLQKNVKSTGQLGDGGNLTTDSIEDLVWGLNVGGGIDISVFTIDIRYQIGFNEVIKATQDFDFNSKSNIFAVSLGWKIL
jgi:hypothetical protein